MNPVFPFFGMLLTSLPLTAMCDSPSERKVSYYVARAGEAGLAQGTALDAGLLLPVLLP